MAIYVIRCQADIATPQRAVAIRDWLKDNIPNDVTVISWDAARVTQDFTVTAVDTTTKEVLTRTVEATDAAAAKTQVASATVVVTDVSA